MNSMKEKYISLTTTHEDIPIFMQPWWLDAVVENDAWDVILIEEARTMSACFVYMVKRKGPFKAVGMPGLTPFLGFWFGQAVNTYVDAPQERQVLHADEL